MSGYTRNMGSRGGLLTSKVIDSVLGYSNRFKWSVFRQQELCLGLVHCQWFVVSVAGLLCSGRNDRSLTEVIDDKVIWIEEVVANMCSNQ
jgi:hypothetical protein